jgi:hypothetical protein
LVSGGSPSVSVVSDAVVSDAVVSDADSVAVSVVSALVDSLSSEPPGAGVQASDASRQGIAKPDMDRMGQCYSIAAQP